MHSCISNLAEFSITVTNIWSFTETRNS